MTPIGPTGHLPTPALHWQFDNSYEMQGHILKYERDHMTMSRTYPGSDPHGWRNALNHFGWGSIDAGVYVDSAYSSFDKAARATVSPIARFDKPVGILGWFGAHAQMVTGYTVHGEDPRVSDDWTIIGVYITDPLQADQHPKHFRSLRGLAIRAAVLPLLAVLAERIVLPGPDRRHRGLSRVAGQVGDHQPGEVAR